MTARRSAAPVLGAAAPSPPVRRATGRRRVPSRARARRPRRRPPTPPSTPRPPVRRTAPHRRRGRPRRRTCSTGSPSPGSGRRHGHPQRHRRPSRSTADGSQRRIEGQPTADGRAPAGRGRDHPRADRRPLRGRGDRGQPSGGPRRPVRLIDLDSGGTARLDQDSSPPTTTGGTWAHGRRDLLVHATVDHGGAYCLATVSLESGQGDTPAGAPEPRHGFRGAVISDAGLERDELRRPAPGLCGTLLAIDGADATPFEGVTDCQGWDAARLDDGAVWSEVPEAQPPGARRLPRPRRRRDLRPRARHDREPGVVRRRGVLRPRPADRRPTPPA